MYICLTLMCLALNVNHFLQKSAQVCYTYLHCLHIVFNKKIRCFITDFLKKIESSRLFSLHIFLWDLFFNSYM